MPGSLIATRSGPASSLPRSVAGANAAIDTDVGACRQGPQVAAPILHRSADRSGRPAPVGPAHDRADAVGTGSSVGAELVALGVLHHDADAVDAVGPQSLHSTGTERDQAGALALEDRKSTRLNSSHPS